MSTPLPEKTLQGLRDHIEQSVTTGFLSCDEVIENAVDAFCDAHEPDELIPHAEAIAREVIAEHLQEQQSWPPTTDCDRLDTAFAELERAGIVSRQNFTCCNNCGRSEIPDEIDAAAATGLQVRGYTFYHMQDTERALEGHTLHLSFGTPSGGDPSAALKIGQEVATTLRLHGLSVDWDGTPAHRIGIIMDWKRRLKAIPSAATAS